MESKVSVIVGCTNNSSRLKNMLDMLDRQSIGKNNLQIIIVDNGSYDNGESRRVMMNYEKDNPENTVIIPLESIVEIVHLKEIALQYVLYDNIIYIDLNREIDENHVENLINRNVINVAVALNDNYYMYTYVMLYSLLVNNRRSRIHIFLLNDCLKDEHINGFKTLAMDFGACVNDVKVDSANVLDKLSLSHERFSKETYFRLGITELLPETVDRILYLDADTLVNGDIYEMYSADFNGNELMAVKETTAFDEGDERKAMFGELLDSGYVYFNAGVLLMNIELLRGKYTLDNYIGKLNSLKESGYRVTFQDQDLLNLVHHEKVGYIEPEHDVSSNRYCLFSRYAYNHGMDYAAVKRDAKIIHYCGYKPWNGDGMHYNVELLWWDYARQTVYYGILLDDYLYKTMTDGTIFNTYLEQRITINKLTKQLADLKK